MEVVEKGALRIVQDAWKRAHDAQSGRNDIYVRLEQRYKGYNPNIADPYRSAMIMPKLYSAIETITPRISKAIFGKRPYIPIKSDKNPLAAKAIEAALDAYLYRDRFKIKGGQLIKGVSLFGTGFLEPVPAKRVSVEHVTEPSPVWPHEEISQDKPISRFALDIRQYAAWQVYVEPHMTSLDDPGFAIITEIVAKSEVQKMIDSDRYLPVDLSAEGETEDKKFSEEMFAALKIDRPNEDLDYGVLMRYQSKDKYITIWNGIGLLEDVANPYKHGKINIVRFTWNGDPFLQNSFWGQPEAKACEALLDKYDESRNQVADNNDISIQSMIAYREEAVEPEQIVAMGGARVPIKRGFVGSIADAIAPIPIRGLPPEAYALPEIYDREIDRAMGVFAPNRGEPSGASNDQTATESSLLAASGDLRNEFRTQMFESGLSDLADRCTSHIDQFAPMDDLIAEIGELAMETNTMNPNMLPGGFAYQFKGSDAIINDFQQAANLRGNADILMQSPAVYPDSLARMVADKNIGLSEREIAELVMDRETFMEMMTQQKQEADDERIKDLIADVILAQEQGKVKGKENDAKPKGKADTKKRKAATTPNASNPAGRAV